MCSFFMLIMSFIKYYKVICDSCGKEIAIYKFYKSSTSKLRKDGIIVKINNSHILTYCNDCISK